MSASDIDLNIISKVNLFDGIRQEMMPVVSGYLVRKSFKAGEKILEEGESGDEIFILIAGRVQISQNLVLKGAGQDFEEKNKTLIVLDAELLPVFGEMSLLESAQRTATVTAVEDCITYVVQRSQFIRLCNEYSEIGLVIMKNLAKILSFRLRKANKDVLKLTTALSIVMKK